MIEPIPHTRLTAMRTEQMLTTLTILSRDQGNIYVPHRGYNREKQSESRDAVVKQASGPWQLRNFSMGFLGLPRRNLFHISSVKGPVKGL
ncbi:hypothetical protein ATC00_02200 [Sinorhizobium americanum]|nr:hypothetical protein ATC00_02200 [Sinorhizobium americanum]